MIQPQTLATLIQLIERAARSNPDVKTVTRGEGIDLAKTNHDNPGVLVHLDFPVTLNFSPQKAMSTLTIDVHVLDKATFARDNVLDILSKCALIADYITEYLAKAGIRFPGSAQNNVVRLTTVDRYSADSWTGVIMELILEFPKVMNKCEVNFREDNP